MNVILLIAIIQERLLQVYSFPAMRLGSRAAVSCSSGRTSSSLHS